MLTQMLEGVVTMTALNDEYQNMAANAICHAAQQASYEIQVAAQHYTCPSVVWKPKLSIDGDQWCALFGDDLQSGVAGFGASPQEAMWDFDKAWCRKLTPSNTQAEGRASRTLPRMVGGTIQEDKR